MKKNIHQLAKRKIFVRLAFNNNKEAAWQLRSLALGLENCRNTKDIAYALSEILYLSEATLFNDYSKD